MIDKKEPPDKYKTIKIPLREILSGKTTLDKLPITVNNQLVIYVYQFLRPWILSKFAEQQNARGYNVPLLTTDIIKMAFRLFLSDPSNSRKVLNLRF